MSSGLGKCSKIRHIERLRQMLRRWRNKARMSASRIPSDVPAGHVAVCMGTNRLRLVVEATHLNHPVFQKFPVQAEEEYGFTKERWQFHSMKSCSKKLSSAFRDPSPGSLPGS